jgi:SRSO17 transposase
LRDVVRNCVFEALGNANGILVVDETGFVKKGKHSVGVARQHTGTAGRIENAQVGRVCMLGQPAWRRPDRPAAVSPRELGEGREAPGEGCGSRRDRVIRQDRDRP